MCREFEEAIAKALEALGVLSRADVVGEGRLGDDLHGGFGDVPPRPAVDDAERLLNARKLDLYRVGEDVAELVLATLGALGVDALERDIDRAQGDARLFGDLGRGRRPEVNSGFEEVVNGLFVHGCHW